MCTRYERCLHEHNYRLNVSHQTATAWFPVGPVPRPMQRCCFFLWPRILRAIARSGGRTGSGLCLHCSAPSSALSLSPVGLSMYGSSLILTRCDGVIKIINNICAASKSVRGLEKKWTKDQIWTIVRYPHQFRLELHQYVMI